MVGVKAAPRGRGEIVPGHVRGPDIDASVGHDVLGVIHARMARIFADTSARAVPARDDELFDRQLRSGECGSWWDLGLSDLQDVHAIWEDMWVRGSS